MENIKKLLIISSDKNLLEVLNFCFDGWGYEVHLHNEQIHDVSLIKKISPDVVIVDVHSASKSHLDFCRLLKDDFLTAFIPVITLINKRQLRSQLLSLKQGVDDYLIKPPDPLDLRIRVEMAIRRWQCSFQATPLTGLPGGRIIEETLQEKVKQKDPFSFAYLDIDNFKYFNDVYGYLKGDGVILQTAYILYSMVKKFGNPEDFIGHIGGDDFIFISTPERHRQICQNFILTFDKVVPFHYSPEDRRQGFIVAKDRSHQIKNIPLMSVTVAVLHQYHPNEFKNTVEINERITEIKRYLKMIPGSKFMADRRNLQDKSLNQPVIYKREAAEILAYKPLGQILVERNLLSLPQLEEALKVHWKRGLILGEALKELGFIKDEDLKAALQAQEILGR